MSDFEEKLKKWTEDSEFDLKLHRNDQDYPLSGDPLWITRCLKLITVIRKQMEYIENHATGLSGYNPSLARQILQECEEMLNGDA